MILLKNQMVAANGVMNNNETNLFSLKSRNADTAKSTSGFSDAFNSAVNNSKKLSARNNQDSTQAQSTSNIKSFREAQNLRSNKVESDKKVQTQQEKPLVQISEEQKNDSSNTDNSNQMIAVMAQMMGIKPEELFKIAQNLGFSQQDLQNGENMQQFIGQLSNMLSLSDDQAAVLEQVTAKVEAVVNGKVEQSGVDTIKENSAQATTAKQIDSVLEYTNDLSELTKFSQQIKNKLNQLMELSEAVPKAIEGEIAKVMEHLKSQVDTKLSVAQTPQVTEGSTTEGILGVAKNQSQSNTSNAKDDTNGSNDQNTDQKASNTENTENTEQVVKGEAAAAKAQAEPLVQESDFNQHLNSHSIKINGEQHLSDIKNLSSARATSQAVKPSEIINQVIDKAKVVIGLEKTEMIIDLKPDNLGKLSLKIITEQGIVAAKFMAENQQVKEVLESNMQLLKDSLQKQGISIEGVSVQVADRDKSSYEQQRSFEGKNDKSNKDISSVSASSIPKASGGLYVSSNILDVLPERLAQYSYESSSINMRA